jgi:type I restriction enzyme M protein
LQRTDNNTSPELSEYIDYLRGILKDVQNPILAAETALLNAWKQEAVQFLSTGPKNDIEWLAVAQHHGLATRLLDWTRSPLVAAYFALEPDANSDAVIFALVTSFAGAPSDDLFKRMDAENLQEMIVRIEPPAIAQRIVRQKGLFSATRRFWVDLRHAIQTGMVSGVVRAIRIPAAARREIFRNIIALGIDRSVLFPDLDGLANHLNFVQSSRNFLRDGAEDEWEPGMLRQSLDSAKEKRDQLSSAVRDRLAEIERKT